MMYLQQNDQDSSDSQLITKPVQSLKPKITTTNIIDSNVHKTIDKLYLSVIQLHILTICICK